LQITASDRAIIDWTQFSIDEKEITQFIQPSASSSVLNRVASAEPSRLLGQMISNGQVILINPNGILVGLNARIDTGSFIASTLDLQNNIYLSSRELSFEGSSGVVTNEGTIYGREGDVFLIGNSVVMKGTIESAQGDTALLSASSVVVKATDTKGIYVRSARAQIRAANPFEGAFVPEEIAEQVALEGKITTPGHSVYLLGAFVNLKSGSIDVSHEDAAGQIFIGGSYQGMNPDLFPSLATYVGPEVTLNASSSQKGGQVVVWSEGVTQFHGHIQSRGKTRGGDAEVSGLRNLVYQGDVNLQSLEEGGACGTLLLDPSNIVISSTVSATVPPFRLPPYVYDPVTSVAYLLVDHLNLALSRASVVVQTNAGTAGSGDIIQQPGANISWSADTQLTLRAQRDLLLQSDITAIGTYTGPGSRVNLIADSGRTGTGELQYLQGAKKPTLSVEGGGASFYGANIRLGDPILAQSNALRIGGSSTGAGDLQVITPGNLEINPNVQVEFGSMSLNAGGTLKIIASENASQTVFADAGTQTIQASSIEITGSSGAGFVTAVKSQGAQTFTTRGDVTVRGGSGAGADTQVLCLSSTQTIDANSLQILAGNGSSVIVESVDAQEISLSKALVVQAGTGKNSSATLDSTNSNQTITAGSAQILAGTAVNSAAHVQSAGTQNVRITGSLTLRGGGSSGATAFMSASGTQNISAGHIAMSAGTVDGTGAKLAAVDAQTIAASGGLTLVGGPAASTVSISVSAGAQSVDVGNLSITAGNGTSGDGLFCAGGDQTIKTGPLSVIGGVYARSANIDLSSSDRNQTISASSISLVSGRDAPDTFARIFSAGGQTIESAGDISIDGLNGVDAYLQANGDQNLMAQNFTLNGTSHLTATGSILLVAQHDINMDSDTYISAGGDVKLVCDDVQSNGSVSMALGSKVTSGGALQIFSASHALNSISGLLNGTPFSVSSLLRPGIRSTLLEGTTFVYFLDPTPDSSFTIFYREDPVGARTFEVGPIISEFLVDLHPYDEYFPGWISEFSITGRKLNEPYFLRRRQLKVANNPKTEVRFFE
jgi:filamentous hemagglutinin family protein